MKKHFKLTCICVALIFGVLANAKAQESVTSDAVIESDSSIVFSPLPVFPGKASNGSVVEQPATFVEVDPGCLCEVESNEPQCFVVKKSVLGCVEGIAVLPKDEVWLINARDFVCGETDLSGLKVTQLLESGVVERSLEDITTAHSNSDDLTTVLYVHGNMTSEEFAFARGLQVYRNAFATKADCRGPVRYVIWAWKSEQERVRLYPDFVIKSERSVRLGETFAATLNQFNDRNMVILGYSLGVQVVLSAFDSPNLCQKDSASGKYQVAFAAPAINADFVANHSLHVEFETPVGRTYVFTNRKDRAIRAAQAIIRRKNPEEEASIAGLSTSGKLNLGPVTSVDVFDETGRFHSIERYTRSGTLQSMMAELVNITAANKNSINSASIE